MRNMLSICKIRVKITLLLLIATLSLQANSYYNIVVAKDGSGDYENITEAIESLPMYCYARVTIFIKNGVYNEKIRINRDYVTLLGENRDSTRIEYNQLREDWIKNEDSIGPAVVNIFADDVIITNMTIENTQPEIGPHAFAIYGTGTRTILTKCNVLSKGGDTVSLWDYKTGMYYHDDCHFQGAVDFVCPRGWCYISNSSFYEVKKTAAVWHAAPANKKQKLVLKNCDFQGADSFYIARHHYDAQFYFLNCTFPEIMQNKPIEHVIYKDKPHKNKPYLYGNRYYFYKCSRKAGNYSWFADNVNEWPENVSPAIISPSWTFDYQWNPVDSSNLEVSKIEFRDSSLFVWFNQLAMPVGDLVIQSAKAKIFEYENGVGRDRFEFKGKQVLSPQEITEDFTILKGNIFNISATVIPQKVSKTFKVD